MQLFINNYAQQSLCIATSEARMTAWCIQAVVNEIDMWLLHLPVPVSPSFQLCIYMEEIILARVYTLYPNVMKGINNGLIKFSAAVHMVFICTVAEIMYGLHIV